MLNKTYILLFLLLSQISKGVSLRTGLNIGANVTFGTQIQSFNLCLDVTSSLFHENLISKNGNSILINGSFNYELYNRKFGVKNYGSGIRYSLKALAGWNSALNLAGSIISTTSTNYLIDYSHPSSFNGIGAGIDVNYQFGKLKKFNNRRGNFLGLFSNDKFIYHFNLSNDFKSGILRGKGGDMGETGSFIIKVAHINDNFTDIYGAGLELFTPKPDYSKDPTRQKNSDNDSKIVLASTKPFDDVYHGNIFGLFSRTSNEFTTELKLGVDSKKIGANVQNWLHDTFGLYPRFEWPIEEKNKIFIEAKGGVLSKIITE